MMQTLRWYVFLAIRVLRGGEAAARFLGVTVGKDCRIYTRGFGSEPWLVTIGDRVTATSGVQFITHDGSLWLLEDEQGRRYRYAPITIGNDVFIGVNTIILPGVSIGDRVVIGAGSVVTRSIPSGSVVAGNPARFVKSYDDFAHAAFTTLQPGAAMRGTTYRERVDSIVEAARPPLEPQQAHPAHFPE